VSNGKKKKDGFYGVSIDDGGEISVSIGEALGKPITVVRPSADAKPAHRQGSLDAASLPEYIRSLSQVTLHRESSGRGGRTVTLVSLKPAPDKKTAEALAKLMRKGLGCGSHVEETTVVLQGDIMDRAEAWFAKQGAKRVVRGN
jgi:translation initiation factor 1